MQMIVRTVEKGKRLWSFTVDEKLLYEMLCNCIAWKVISKSGKDADEVMKDTVALAEFSVKRTDDELAEISDTFVRTVFQERKRLKLTEYQLKDTDE